MLQVCIAMMLHNHNFIIIFTIKNFFKANIGRSPLSLSMHTTYKGQEKQIDKWDTSSLSNLSLSSWAISSGVFVLSDGRARISSAISLNSLSYKSGFSWETQKICLTSKNQKIREANYDHLTPNHLLLLISRCNK